MVQLYEKGYGKDAAIIAKEAINYGLYSVLGLKKDLFQNERVCQQ